MTAHPRPGPVGLRASDTARLRAFYEGVLGLEVVDRGGPRTALAAPGAGPILVELESATDDTRPGPGAPGLFHMAFVVPSRTDLARAVAALVGRNVAFQGFSDHLVSESVYLADPEGNGIEIYRDRDPDQWPRDQGRIRMATLPLDVNSLLIQEGVAAPDPEGVAGGALTPGTLMGHVHLRVSELERAEGFLAGVLGMEVTTREYPGALFFSYGGYHHHVGANVWGRNSGGGVGQARGSEAPGLAFWSLEFPEPGGLGAAARAAWEAGLDVDEAKGEVVVTDADGLGVRLLATD